MRVLQGFSGVLCRLASEFRRRYPYSLRLLMIRSSFPRQE